MLASVESTVGNLIESKPVAITALAYLGARYMGLGGVEAFHFGCVSAVGASVGDTVLTGMGYDTDLRSYLPGYQSYVDPLDFVGGGLGSMALFYMTGMRDGLLMASGISAVAAGFGPKLAGMLVAAISGSKIPDASGKGQSLRH